MRDGLGLVVKLSTDPAFFHFNRVDGTYLGVGHTWSQIPGVALRTKLGYASGSAAHLEEMRINTRQLGSTRRRWLRVEAGHRACETRRRPPDVRTRRAGKRRPALRAGARPRPRLDGRARHLG